MDESFMWLYNIGGVMNKLDSESNKEIPVFSFEIRKKRLVKYSVLSDKLLPWFFKRFGISYFNIVLWFRERVSPPSQQFIADTLEEFGLNHYNFEDLLISSRGGNHFDGFYTDLRLLND